MILPHTKKHSDSHSNRLPFRPLPPSSLPSHILRPLVRFKSNLTDSLLFLYCACS